MRMYLFCNRNSSSVHDLRSTIREMGHDCMRIREYHGQKISEGPVFNWGCGGSAVPPSDMVTRGYFNKPEAVIRSCGKYTTYRRLLEAGVNVVAMTQSYSHALTWLNVMNRTVLARADESDNGQGIKVIKPGMELPNADFYSRLYPSTHEFRVHVAFGQAIDIVQKIPRESGVKSHEIRSYGNGWRLSHSDSMVWGDGNDQGRLDDVSITQLKSLGTRAINAVGLDFGAVDIVAQIEDVSDRNNKRSLIDAYVCETNSAPALELDITIEAYAKAFIKKAESL